MQPGSPRVRMPSFLQCLPHLLNEQSPRGVSDVTMMCLLVQFIKPLMRFLFVRTGVCSPASFRLAVTCKALSAGRRIMVQGSTPAHKGLFPRGSLCGTLKIYSLHSCKPRHPCRAHTRRYKRTQIKWWLVVFREFILLLLKKY